MSEPFFTEDIFFECFMKGTATSVIVAEIANARLTEYLEKQPVFYFDGFRDGYPQDVSRFRGYIDGDAKPRTHKARLIDVKRIGDE